MNVVVRYFAAAREAAGVPEEALEVRAGATVGDLAAVLVERHAALARLVVAARFAVGREFARRDAPLEDGAEVAWIPPVSGG